MSRLSDTPISILSARSSSLIDTQFHSIGISEVEFRSITMQMVMAAMLVDAFHAALEDSEEPFNGVGVDD